MFVRRSVVVLAALALLGGPVPVMAAISGPDVSGWQHSRGSPISWSAVRASGHSFAWIKATEGITGTNPYYRRDRAALAATGLARGAYHFARPAGSPAAQARHFVSVVGPRSGPGDLPPVLDLEQSGGLPPHRLVAWTRRFLNEVTARTHRTPIIYTNRGFWRSAMGNVITFRSYPLWIAYYGHRTAPSLPGGWTRWTFWQYSDASRVPGIAGHVDLDRFHGSATELAQLAGWHHGNEHLLPYRHRHHHHKGAGT